VIENAVMNAHHSRRRKLNEEERELWDEITRSVEPLRAPPVGSAAPSPVKIRPAPSALSVAHPPTKEVPQPLEPMERRLKQRLARGLEPIDRSLDLHGKTQAQAHGELLRFLRRSQVEGARFLLVITGKGSRADSSEHGVLKRQVPLWLAQPELRPYVAGFEQAHVRHGGAGALYVRLRRPRRAE
jgi:DNA-nicking Smr family endonuclease